MRQPGCIDHGGEERTCDVRMGMGREDGGGRGDVWRAGVSVRRPAGAPRRGIAASPGRRRGVRRGRRRPRPRGYAGEGRDREEAGEGRDRGLAGVAARRAAARAASVGGGASGCDTKAGGKKRTG